MRSGIERVGARAAVDCVERVVDRDVGHSVETRFVKRVGAGRDACRDRGLTGIRTPDGDGIRPRRHRRRRRTREKRSGRKAYGKSEHRNRL